MCLAIPAIIVKVENNLGTVDIAGVKRAVGLELLEGAKVGDYVIVHAGFAIHKIDESTALESLKALREVLSRLEEPEKSVDKASAWDGKKLSEL